MYGANMTQNEQGKGEDRKFRMDHFRMVAKQLREMAARLEQEAAGYDAEADRVELRLSMGEGR